MSDDLRERLNTTARCVADAILSNDLEAARYHALDYARWRDESITGNEMAVKMLLHETERGAPFEFYRKYASDRARIAAASVM